MKNNSDFMVLGICMGMVLAFLLVFWEEELTPEIDLICVTQTEDLFVSGFRKIAVKVDDRTALSNDGLSWHWADTRVSLRSDKVRHISDFLDRREGPFDIWSCDAES